MDKASGSCTSLFATVQYFLSLFIIIIARRLLHPTQNVMSHGVNGRANNTAIHVPTNLHHDQVVLKTEVTHSNHDGLLSHARTGRVFQVPEAVDVSTTAAFDFDVDAASGFMPPLPPTAILPSPTFDSWERELARATSLKLKPDEAVNLTDEDRAVSETWRAGIRAVRTLSHFSLAQ